MVTYYEILEVSRTASKEVITKAYKVLVRKYHPDLEQDETKKEEAKEKVKKFYDESITNARKEAEELKLKYKNEGEAIAMPIFESAERKVSSIKDIGEDKLKSVVDMIVERIVNSNGNS